jgi:non-canonical purine NTP pyrophosphatase (RdgB/HAM1 family)
MNTHPVFITSNASKVEQLGRHLGMQLQHKRADVPEVQSLSLAEVVEHKAKAAYDIVQAPVIVEDTALTLHALGKLPGPLVKWFFEELGNEGLCRLLDGHADRSATAATLFGYYDGKTLRTFYGETAGTIALHPQGKSDIGWDPVFIPQGHDKTWAEMTREESAPTSMRRIAIVELEVFLRQQRG